MKLLLIHSDFIEYETKEKAGKFAEELPGGKAKGRMDEALVAFIAVEKVDEANPAQAIQKAAHEIDEVARQVKAKRVMLYPYAHLSRELAPPSFAVKALKDLEAAIKGKYEAVERSPFGWYKAFKISAKGHPLSELSRAIAPDGAGGQSNIQFTTAHKAGEQQAATVQAAAPGPAGGEAALEAKVSEAVKKEKKLKSSWYILTPKGDLVDGAKFDFAGHPELKTFYEYEAHGTRTMEKEAPHIAAMRELELVDYEPGSDSGHFRWYPKGQLVKRLLEAHVATLCRNYGALQVETPIMYDSAHPALSKYMQRFPARQYIVPAEDREFFLRFAACFGQYLIMKDATISYRHLPLRLLEITHYSFRREQRGELTGLKRLRAFTMPDMHSLVRDIDDAKVRFLEQFRLGMQWMKDLNLPYEAGVRFVRAFFDENRDFATSIAKTLGRPILIEMWDDRFFYFVTKFEFNVNDAVAKSAALTTVQIDVENAERFGIQYTNEKGERVHPLILHASISGSIDRCLYIVLERQIMAAETGTKPMLPFWLAPTHVRILPVKDGVMPQAEALMRDLVERGRRLGVELRVDIDDRTEGVGRRIALAEKEWTPIILVVGEKEAASSTYEPRFRTATLESAVKAHAPSATQVSADALVQGLADLLRGYPGAPLPLPTHVALRPLFRK